MTHDEPDDVGEIPATTPIVVKPGRYSGYAATGPEPPTRKGWYATEFVDKHGTPLWWKPPGRLSIWLRRISIGILAVAALLVVFARLVVEPSLPPP